MSQLKVGAIYGVNGGPVTFPDGLSIGGNGYSTTNYIGVAGTAGFGVGVCPELDLPSGMSKLDGTTVPTSANYGNYVYSDGSVMVWVPAFFYKYGTGSNGLAVNQVDIKPYTYFTDVSAANAAGYALHRAFYDGGAIKSGFFVDKYLVSNNGGVASSIKNGNPLSTFADHNPLSGLTGTPANTYAGFIDAVQTRGASFFAASVFIHHALALLSLAHGQASTSTSFCAWYEATGTTNFPKGCNNNALGDTDDDSLSFVSDGYSTAAKTGSANFLAKTAHNGQECGVVDLNGCMWEVSLGLTSNGTNIYVMKTSTKMADVTSGNTLATDAWGATGITALYDDLGTSFGSWQGTSTGFRIGNASNQVFSEATSGNAWNASCAGVPIADGVSVSGTNTFGLDGFWDYKPNEMCPIFGGSWDNGLNAGVFALSLNNVRSISYDNVGGRAALYL